VRIFSGADYAAAGQIDLGEDADNIRVDSAANQILVGLSLFMTFFIMEPVWAKIDVNALQPYMAKEISSEQALIEASKPIRAFMLKQARAKDVELFAGLANVSPKTADDLPTDRCGNKRSIRDRKHRARVVPKSRRLACRQ